LHIILFRLEKFDIIFMRGCSKMDIEQEATNTSSDIQKQDGANGIRIKRL